MKAPRRTGMDAEHFGRETQPIDRSAQFAGLPLLDQAPEPERARLEREHTIDARFKLFHLDHPEVLEELERRVRRSSTRALAVQRPHAHRSDAGRAQNLDQRSVHEPVFAADDRAQPELAGRARDAEAAQRMSTRYCKRGHHFSPENTEIDHRGRRRCRTCHRSANAAGARRRRAERRERQRSVRQAA
jgi:hypothetical protein